MEREVGEGRRRRGRGIIVGGMILSLLLGCNNGGESAAEKGLSEIIASSKQLFLDAFVSFGDLLKESFGITETTTKQAVGEKLGNLGEAVNSVKSKLEGIKSDENYNLIKDRADGVITKAIGTLANIVNGVNKIKDATRDAASDKIANSVDSQDAVAANTKSVGDLVEGISMIYGAAKENGTDSKGKDNKTIDNSANVGKLFHTNSTASTNGVNALKDARRAVIAASGADILAAIESVKDKSKDAGNIDAAKNAFEMAIATQSDGTLSVGVQTNASAIASGLVLRAMAQNGKLAAHNTNAKQKEVNAVLVEVVEKTVNEIVSIIRKTVDKCLKDVSDCIKEDSSSIAKSSK